MGDILENEWAAFDRQIPSRFSNVAEDELRKARILVESISTASNPAELKDIYNQIGEILDVLSCGFRALDIEGNLSEKEARIRLKLIVATRHRDIARDAVAALRTMDKPYDVDQLVTIIQENRRADIVDCKWSYKEVDLEGGRAMLQDLVESAREKRRSMPDQDVDFFSLAAKSLIKLSNLAAAKHQLPHTILN